jgi:hypothetical protein
MTRVVIAMAAALILAGCGGADPETNTTATVPETAPPSEPDKAALTSDAKAAVMAMAKTLQGELQGAIKAGGPASAVGVCHTVAPTVAASLSEQHGVSLTRVSLKNRNPNMGVPNEWQAAVLQDFEARKAAGEAADTLAYSEIVGDEHRFMKAIPTQKVCLACHGSDVGPDVQAKITELYPEDRAVGYQEGELRGAFVVVRQLGSGG